jgi:very-short-patch-repair endonuclease
VGRPRGAYDPKDGPHWADHAIRELAGRQHGVVSAAQLLDLGLTREMIKGRVRAEHLVRLHRAVYAVGHDALEPRGRELASVLACGPDAVASHRMAGTIWGFLRSAPRYELTAPRSRAPRHGIVVHRSRRLAAADRALVDAVPVTSVARTIVDLADVLTEKRLAHAVHEAEVLRIFDLASVEEAVARVPARPGRGRLARVVAAYEEPPMTRNEAERRFLRLCASHSLPQPETNQLLHGYEVDFHWPATDLVVEIDGAAAHHTRKAFEQDRRRDRALAKEGIQVLRIAAGDLEGGAADIAALFRR